MFGKVHIIYMLTTALVGVAIILPLYFLKWRWLNRFMIKLFAIASVLLVYSPLWIDFFSTGRAEVSADMILPIHPFIVCVWFLVFSSTVLNSGGFLNRLVRDFSFFGGIVFGFIGVVFMNFGENTDLGDFSVLRILLASTAMVYASVLLYTSGIVRIRFFRSSLAALLGIMTLLACGLVVNELYERAALPPCNAMGLLENPFPNAPHLSSLIMAIIALVAVMLFSGIYEIVLVKLNERKRRKSRLL